MNKQLGKENSGWMSGKKERNQIINGWEKERMGTNVEKKIGKGVEK